MRMKPVKLLYKKHGRKHTVRIPWLRFNRTAWGTVYLMQARNEPRLFKVGYTSRRTIERRAELNRVAGDDMAIVATVSMPWARACEAELLRRLRFNLFRKRDGRGTEWFWLRPGETIHTIQKMMGRVMVFTRFVARCKLSWPKGADPRVAVFGMRQ